MRTLTTGFGLALSFGAVLAHPAAAQVDRYGGSPHARPVEVASAGYPAQASAAPPVRAASGHTLSWPGKTSGPVAPREPAPVYQAPAAYAPPPAPAPQPGPRAAANNGFVPLYGPASKAAPAQPTSIYDAPPPQAQVQSSPAPPAQPVRQASAHRADGPRFYSVHRDFGITPDAAPIPPAFFTATADLSEPPADNDRERRLITGADGKTTTVIRRASGSEPN